MGKVAETEKAIENYVNEHRFVSTDDMAIYFSMTPQSIRRYTKSLSEQGLISKSHGGAAKIDFNGVKPVHRRFEDYYKPLKIESLSLICFEAIHCNNEYISRLRNFLSENSRIDPLIHLIIETANAGWASSEADKVLRKINKSQVAIFCETLTDIAINVALIAKKNEFETFLVSQETSIDITSEIDLLRAQDIGLMSLGKFKSEWKYARI